VGIGLYHQVEDRRAGVAGMVRVLQAVKDQIASVVDGINGYVLGEGLGGLVELEAGENVEGEALAMEAEEAVGFGPVEEIQG